jgi:hypothetical protein
MAPGATLRQALTLWRMPSRITFAVIGMVLLLLVAAWLLAWRTAGQLVDSLRWFGTPEYASVSVGPLGTIEYRDFRLHGRVAGEPDVFAATRVNLQTPGLHWLVWHGLVHSPASDGLVEFLGSERRASVERTGGIPRAFPAAGRLVLSIDGLVPGPGLAQAGDLRWIGLASGAPLDAEGCDGRSRFTAADLVEMGISDAPTRAEAAFVVERGDTARITFGVEHPGASRSELSMDVRADNVRGLLDSDWSQVVILDRRWTTRDQGLVSARNRWCAARMGISRDGYVDRHLAAIKSDLATIGATPTAELQSAYRRYAARGGEITWHSQPSLTTPVGQLATFALGDRLRILNATLESVRGRAAAFRFTIAAPVVPAVDTQVAAGPPIEGGGDPALVPGVDPAGSAPATDPGVPAGDTAAAPLATAGSAPESLPGSIAASTPDPAPAPAPERAPPAATAPAVQPAPARPVATIAPPPVAPSVERAPARLPTESARQDPFDARADVPAPSLATRTPPLVVGRDLAYADLALLEGRRIEVRSVYGSIRRGTLEKYTDTAITIRLEARERGLSVTMPNQTVQSVRLLDRAVGPAEPADG